MGGKREEKRKEKKKGCVLQNEAHMLVPLCRSYQAGFFPPLKSHIQNKVTIV